MQPDVITLSIDKLNDGNPTTEDFTRTDFSSTRSQYEGESHSYASRDTIHLYRTQPKQAGNSKGVMKSAVKHTIDVIVDGVNGDPVSGTVIAHTQYSIPVGTDPALVKAIRQREIAITDDDIVMDKLNLKLNV